MTKMFALIWIHLLYFVGFSTGNVDDCNKRGYCVNLSEYELRAEAGLCVVIPCNYSVHSSFTPQHIIWYKCNPWEKRCADTDMIFHSNKQSKKPRPAFLGRVSLLEPDMQKKTCSIVINDLAESDSGWYQFKVNGRIGGHDDKYHFYPKTSVKVTELQKTPSLLIPPLTEGEQTTLTCVSPGSCSGSDPEITWIWSKPGEINSEISRNLLKNMEVTPFKQNSTLTFNPSAEYHRANITCRVKFTGNITTENSSTVSVTYMKELQIIGDTSVKEGETLNLTCTVESFPPSQITWQNGTKTDEQENESVMLFISNMTKEHSGRYVCVAKHRNKTQKADVDVAVIYHRRPRMVGNTTLTRGEDVNLTCVVDTFPPSSIFWTKVGSNLTLLSGQGSQSLLIRDVTAADSGRYVCTVKYQNDTVTLWDEVVVTWLSEIQNGSKCELDAAAGLLTCVCISEGFPLPTITWPLLKGHRENSVLTTTSNYTVSSTLTLKHRNKTTVECISSNDNREARGNLRIQTKLSSKEEAHSLLHLGSRSEVIFAFLIGILLTALVFGLVIIGYRGKKKNTRNSDGTVELSSHDDPQMLGHDEECETMDSKDLTYANIDFSKIKKKERKNRESTRTEYAEIKRKVRDVREEERRGDEEENEKEKMMEEEEKETEACAQDEEEEEEKEEEEEEEEEEVEEEEEEEEEEVEEEVMYSNMKEVMADI